MSIVRMDVVGPLHEKRIDVIRKHRRSSRVAQVLEESAIVTVVCGYSDPDTLEITYASAGHPSPIVTATGTDPLVLSDDGIPFGFSIRHTAPEHSLRVDRRA